MNIFKYFRKGKMLVILKFFFIVFGYFLVNFNVFLYLVKFENVIFLLFIIIIDYVLILFKCCVFEII